MRNNPTSAIFISAIAVPAVVNALFPVKAPTKKRVITQSIVNNFINRPLLLWINFLHVIFVGKNDYELLFLFSTTRKFHHKERHTACVVGTDKHMRLRLCVKTRRRHVANHNPTTALLNHTVVTAIRNLGAEIRSLPIRACDIQRALVKISLEQARGPSKVWRR